MSNWDYGNAFARHPVDKGRAIFADGSCLKTHDIFDPLPSFMREADLIFTDSPWNKGNLRSFYTKADMPLPNVTFEAFYNRLFDCIREISPDICYTEIGKEYLADFILAMRQQYPYVTFYNSTYYHNKNNLCYVVRGAKKSKKPKLDGMDEEDIIGWVCQNEAYTCVGDLCMGRGLVAAGALRAGRRFVGTELNHKRLSVALETIAAMGGVYTIES